MNNLTSRTDDWAEGYEAGYNTGYDAGYDAGIKDHTSQANTAHGQPRYHGPACGCNACLGKD